MEPTLRKLITCGTAMLLFVWANAQTYVNKDWKMGHHAQLHIPQGPPKIKREFPFRVIEHPPRPKPPFAKHKTGSGQPSTTTDEAAVPLITPEQEPGWGWAELLYNPRIRTLYKENGWF